MNKLSINLLPLELRDESKFEKKTKLLNLISLIFLLVMVLLVTGVLMFRFIQHETNKKLNDEVLQAKEKISLYKPQEELIFVLKNHLQRINALLSQESQQVKAFNLLTALTPSEVKINSFNADRGGKVLLSGETASLSAIDELFSNLTDPKKHEGRVLGARVENLSRSRDERIKFDMTISLK